MGSLKFFPGSKMRHPNVRYRQQAFTLIELLVVISVILIAASIVVVTGRGGSGAALSSSTRIVSSVVQGARGQAILKNAQARLIIYANQDLQGGEADPDRFLRFFGIVYSEDGGNTWTAATQGTYLPRGIYFDPDLSASATGSAWSTANTMPLDFPRSVALAGGSEVYYYFEFEPNGRASIPNAWLAIRAGSLRPDGSGNLSVEFPAADEEDGMLKAALIIRQAGTTTIVTDPSEIQ